MKIDFTKTLHLRGRYKWIRTLNYVGPVERRDNKPITDGYKHLFLAGKENKPYYVNELGQVKDEVGKVHPFVSNQGEVKPKEEPTTPSVGKEVKTLDTSLCVLTETIEELTKEVKYLRGSIGILTEELKNAPKQTPRLVR